MGISHLRSVAGMVARMPYCGAEAMRFGRGDSSQRAEEEKSSAFQRRRFTSALQFLRSLGLLLSSPSVRTKRAHSSMAHPGPTALEAVLDLPTQAEFQRTVPTDWRGLFIRQYTDAGVYSGLLPVSRTTRDWVLQTAPEATMSLPVPAPSAQLAAVSQALATRGDRPTSLRVSCQDGLLDAAAPLLAGLSGSSIQALQVMPEQYADPPSATALTTFLQHAGSALPALASLHLDLPCILPPPEHLPQITHLHVTLDALDPTARAITITPYLTQLTSLSVAEPNIQYRPWPDIFTQKAPKLRDLSTSGPIQNGLISRLIDHAPRLKTLQARRLDLRGPRVEKWAVESVGVDNGFQLDALAGLPGLYKGAEDGERERCGVRGEYCGVAVSHAEVRSTACTHTCTHRDICTHRAHTQVHTHTHRKGTQKTPWFHGHPSLYSMCVWLCV